MKSTLYIFLLTIFSFFVFVIVCSIFKSENPSTDFLLSVIAVHFILSKLEKYYKETINTRDTIDSSR